MPFYDDEFPKYDKSKPVAPKVPVKPKLPVPPGPVKTGGTYTVFPNKAYNAAVQAATVRKDEPPPYKTTDSPFEQLAKDIALLTSLGPGKVTQKRLNALHVKAQSLLGKI